MAKKSGNNRISTSGSSSSLHDEVESMRASDNYSQIEEYNGGYLAIEKSSKKHSTEEIEAARYIAKMVIKLFKKTKQVLKPPLKVG